MANEATGEFKIAPISPRNDGVSGQREGSGTGVAATKKHETPPTKAHDPDSSSTAWVVPTSLAEAANPIGTEKTQDAMARRHQGVEDALRRTEAGKPNNETIQPSYSYPNPDKPSEVAHRKWMEDRRIKRAKSLRAKDIPPLRDDLDVKDF